MHINNINKLLNLQDINIVKISDVYENSVEIILEPLNYIQNCPCCNNRNVIRKGSSGYRKVRHLPLCGNKTFLLLPKIRLYCKDCLINFTFKYSFVDGKSRYTNQYNDNLANAVTGSTVAHASEFTGTPYSTVERIFKNYLNNAQSTTELNKFKQLTELNENNYILDFTKGKSVYSFDDATLVTAYSNTPQYNMIKNDFIVWGKREIAGLELPIRYHLAIDKKPEIQDATYHRWLYTDPDTEITSLRKPIIISPLPQPGSVDYYYTEGDGSPAYPVYYWDVETQGYIALNTNLYKAVEPNGNPNKMTDWRYQLYLSDAEAGDQGLEPSRYYAEMKAEFPKIFDVENEEYIKTYDGADLDYWLDFIDSDAAIQELSVNNIGVRSKVVVDDSINCLFEPAIPEVAYIRLDDEEMAEKKQEANDNGVPWSVTSETIYDALAYGGGFNSAYDLVRSLLYQYTSYNEGITLQTIPIYHLEPNTRISVVNGASGISGDYVINSMSIPLDINGTMSISCTRALERL